MTVIREVSFAILPETLKRQSGLAVAAVLKGLRSAARRGEAHVVAKSADFADQSIFLNAWDVHDTTTGAEVVNDAPHASIVELGSRPHWPPVMPILEYIARKEGIGIPNLPEAQRWDLSDLKAFRENDLLEELRQIAVAVCRRIAARGTKGKHILRDSEADFERFARAEVDAELFAVEGRA